MELTFLGTSAMVPTKDRNHSGIFLEFRSDGVLFDCGEGIQRQFRIAGIAPSKVTIICISHWHGDHVLGLPGLVQTLGANEYTGTLRVFGPPGTKKFFQSMMMGFAGDIFIDIEVTDATEGVFFETDTFTLSCIPLEHSVPCIGFCFLEKDRRRINLPVVRKLGIPDGPLLGRLQEGSSVEWQGKSITSDETTTIVKGRKFVYIGDTQFCSNAVTLATDADVLVTESTHGNHIEEKAEAYKHMTAKQAAMIANQAGVKKLIITHFSQRYKTVEMLEEEARTVFAETTCAFDFMKVKM